MDMFLNSLDNVVLGNRILDYLISLAIFIAGALVVKIAVSVFIARIKKWSETTSTTFDDFLVRCLERVFYPLLYFGAFYVSVRNLYIIENLERLISGVAVALVAFFSARFSILIISYAFELYLIRTGKTEALERSFAGIMRVIKFVIWGLALVLFLDNMGFQVSAVLAGLGVGGIAIGLAAQAVLKDLFSYFSIIFDRPFEVGDFIIIGDYLGAVEYIGAKTTRIRSLGGEQLIFSNTDLTDSRVRNYKRMEKRRVLFKLGVVYHTPVKVLKEIPEIIRNIIENTQETVFDRAHFFSYADFSLVFEIVYYVIGPDYNKYMDIQQKINFEIKEEFEKRGIEFAYPTQTLILDKPK
jgi:small-conductance mechanosensitive channel